MPVFQFSGNLNPEKTKIETFRDEINTCVTTINDELAHLASNWVSEESKKDMPSIQSCMEEIQTANTNCMGTVATELSNLESSLRALGGSGGN